MAETSRDSATERLVSTALAQDKLSGLGVMLECLAGLVHADACIVWQIAPGYDLGRDPPIGHLFALAQWFRSGITWTTHNLELTSVTGNAVVTGVPENVLNINKHPRIDPNQVFFQRTGVGVFCTVPVAFPDGTPGAANAYRVGQRPFSRADFLRLRALAKMLPDLYQAIRDRVSFNLITGVNQILHEAELGSKVASRPEVDKTIRTVCDLVSGTFHALETSVYFEDPVEAPGDFRLAATTWPGFAPKMVYRKKERGLTSWVITQAKAVNIFDLACFEADGERIRGEYPGVTWEDSYHLLDNARVLLDLQPEDTVPPLSFMAAPVLVGEGVSGVIRCCVAKKPPYFFAKQERGLLGLVAARISHYWNNWLSRRDLEEENRSWRALVESVSSMNKFVHRELSGKSPDEVKIFNEALRITSSVIRGAEAMDVRAFDEASGELYFAAVHGKLWNEGSQNAIAEKRNRRFPALQKPPESMGANVYQTGKLWLTNDVTADPRYSATFPATTRMIIAPISSQDRIFGVLDIRGTGKLPWPKHAEAIAELLGRQLGLYHYLALTIGELQGHVARQTQTYSDLGHQLKTPVILAYARVQSLLKSSLTDPVRVSLLPIRGILAKAKRVAMSTRLFAELADTGRIAAKPRPVDFAAIVRLVSEVAVDNEELLDRDREIKFRVLESTFRGLQSSPLNVDLDLLEQALSTLLDNAGKYSSSRSRVELFGGITGRNRFHITVRNKGIRLAGRELSLCVQRGWRGEEAQWVTGEGSGIGLWIVDHIMRAHGGELLIVPTNAVSATEVKLLFPIPQR